MERLRLTTQALRTERARLDEQKRRYAAIVESSDDAIIGEDLDGVILTWNRAAVRMFGYTSREVIGRPITIVIPADLHDEEKNILNRVRAGKTLAHYETTRISNIGRKLEVSITISPIKDARGVVTGASSIVRDITETKRAEAGLRESEELFRLSMNNTPAGMYILDARGSVTYVNPAAKEILGCTSPELLKTFHDVRHYKCLPMETDLRQRWIESIHPDDSKRYMAIYKTAFDRREPFQVDYRLRRNDAKYRWVIDSGVPTVNTNGSFSGYTGSIHDVTDRRLAEEALSQLSQKLMEAHEEERTWIARELHDDINQRLALLAVYLDGLKQDSAFEQKVAVAKKEIEDLVTDVQALSHRLHSSKLDQLGLVAAAGSYCRELSERQHVEIDFRTTNIPKDLPQEVALCLFRILQEALQNAIRHSGLRHFQVFLNGEPNEVELTVHDSGIGFASQKVLQKHGLGLTSMNERLKLVNGILIIDSKEGRGTTVHARVPLRPKVKSAAARG